MPLKAGFISRGKTFNGPDRTSSKAIKLSMIRLGEFRFLNDPTTYWTLTKNVTNFAKPIPTPTPLPTARPESTPLATESPTPTSKQHNRENEKNASFDDDNGRRIWHRVDGKWKGTLLINAKYL
jgi:hypothetical protein